jgi:hypothetical protein
MRRIKAMATNMAFSLKSGFQRWARDRIGLEAMGAVANSAKMELVPRSTAASVRPWCIKGSISSKMMRLQMAAVM